MPQIAQAMDAQGMPFDVSQSAAPGHAIDLAHQAALDGYQTVVAVGGDGTCNEVINGLMQATAQGQRPILGIIPVGSGNDLAYALNLPQTVAAACARLGHGSRQHIDVGEVSVDGFSRYFGNNLGLGFDAEVAVDVAQNQRFDGFAMYLWSVLRVLARGRWPYDMIIGLNGSQNSQPVTLILISNGRRAGGGFLLTPEAKLDDGLFDICYAGSLTKPQLLWLLPKTFNGSHIHHPQVVMARTNQINITVDRGVAAHVDGEILSRSGQVFEVRLLPKALEVWV